LNRQRDIAETFPSAKEEKKALMDKLKKAAEKEAGRKKNQMPPVPIGKKNLPKRNLKRKKRKINPNHLKQAATIQRPRFAGGAL